MVGGVHRRVKAGSIAAADIEVDYVTTLFQGHKGHLAFFTIKLGKKSSHYALLVNGAPPAIDMKEDELREFIAKNLVGAVHVRTCEHIAH